MGSEPAAKRARVSHGNSDGEREADGADDGTFVLKSMSTPVSPPRTRRREEVVAVSKPAAVTEMAMAEVATATVAESQEVPDTGSPPPALRSPFQLTSIYDLPASANVDTLTVRDVFGDPHVVECWEFNFLHDLDFLMSAFDEGARQQGLAVHVVHGFWKREDPRRERLETAARQYPEDGSQGGSITLHTALMPEPFGTHHTKMAVLLRSDDTAQVVIHTANLIPHDWCNMTQAVWRSPLLPLLRDGDKENEKEAEDGAGHQFKHDFLSYLRSYNQRRSVCCPLVEALERYDFSAVRAVLIGSVPGRHHVPFPDEQEEEEKERKKDGGRRAAPRWGWMAIKHALRDVPLRPQSGTSTASSASEVVMQVSSIATLGGNDTWLQKTLFAAFSGGQVTSTSATAAAKPPASFGPLRLAQQQPPKPQFRIMFPTADEIRRSLEGYASGTSIHTKIQSPQQQKQLAYMRPMMCHWANDAADGEIFSPTDGRSDGGVGGDAKRRRAAPHVKTYVRYNGNNIDWALLTSANLSKQAWGEARSAAGEMRVASYELGVLVWPELLTGVEGATMRPVFGRDDFEVEGVSTEDQLVRTASNASTASATSELNTNEVAANVAASDADQPPVVPLRIPYSLPLQRYGANEVPWVTSMAHAEPDWRGMTAVH